MEIKDSEIKKICSPTIYKRGCEYYKEGRVHLKVRTPEELSATVDGSSRYSVHIKFDGNTITDSLCTCPYYKTMGFTCKHIIAALKTRQTELASSAGENENDRLAALLCNEFNAFETEIYHLNLTFRITPVGTKTCYSAFFSVCPPHGLSIPTPAEQFIDALCKNKEYKLSKTAVFSPRRCRFDYASEAIIKLFKQVYENKISDSTFYLPQQREISFGEATAFELFKYASETDCQYIIDGTPYSNPPIMHENPDILLDVTAMEKSITVSLTESGIALIPDGSIFFFEGKIFFTTEEWRQWFMPFYRSMIMCHRTQLEFSGEASVDFAAKVLPNIKSKQGVVCYNTDELIINEKPKFKIYLDTFNEGISAVIKAFYGNIAVTLHKDIAETDRILVRDTESENQILSYFKRFHACNGIFILYDEEKIFDFLTNIIPELSDYAELMESDEFTKLISSSLPKISASVGYNENNDLLEYSVESSLSEEELSALLNAFYSNSEYFRLKNGAFVNLKNSAEELGPAADLCRISPGHIKGIHRISKYYSLYLASQSKEYVKSEKSFSDMISKAMNTKMKIPSYLKNTLRGYQKKGVNWFGQLSRLGLGGILADDMGLGKTLQVIAFIVSEQPALPALIVVPSSLTYNWLSEINRFAPEVNAKIIDGTKEARENALQNTESCTFIITSYALLKRDSDEYENLKFSYCFIDEAQYIKNAKTKNAQAVKKINAERYFALTGTPIENSLSELWSIFDFVMPGYLSTHKDFAARYEKETPALDDLRNKVRPFILRRMKKDVLSELPEKIENTVYSDFEDEQRDIYAAFLNEARKEIDGIFKSGENAVRILSLLTRLRQICCHPRLINPNYKKESGKLSLLKELVISAVSSGHRILIFSQFTSMLGIINDCLSQKGISCFYLDGSTPSSERIQMANRFNGGERQVFLISLKAGGTGLNLIGADTVIHYDPWWNPAVTDQASDRAYRIGQTRAVQVIKLVTKNSIEEKILKLSEKKRGLADNIIRENKSLLSSLSKDELLSLFGM